MKVFVFDLDKCNGCHNCQIACKDEHAGNDWSPYALPQPDTGQFWCKVDEEVCGKVPHVRVNYLPRLCNHCDEAPCRAASPRRTAPRTAATTASCSSTRPRAGPARRSSWTPAPTGAIYWNEELGLAAEVHGLRPPARRRLGRAALRGRLLHGRLTLRRGRGVRLRACEGRDPVARVGHRTSRVLPQQA